MKIKLFILMILYTKFYPTIYNLKEQKQPNHYQILTASKKREKLKNH